MEPIKRVLLVGAGGNSILAGDAPAQNPVSGQSSPLTR
jgi:hypothetical protein